MSILDVYFADAISFQAIVTSPTLMTIRYQRNGQIKNIWSTNVAESPVSLIAFQYPKPEKRDELESRLKELATASAKEPGCLVYELATLAEDQSVFVFYERWANQADLDRHFNGETFQAFWAERMTYLTKDVEVKILQAI